MADNKTTYLVTSAAGFMGGIVCRKLLERGETVRAFVLKDNRSMGASKTKSRSPSPR